MEKLWVRRSGDLEESTIKVSTHECKDLDDFKGSVQKAFPKLAKFSRADLSITLPDEGEAVLSPETLLSTLCATAGFVNDVKRPLFVRAAVENGEGSVHKQLRYKKMSVEASCRKYFDALATNISWYYDFEWKTRRPTIGDVLEAYRKGDWTHTLRWMTLEEVTDKEGYILGGPRKEVPKLDIPLQELFTGLEWAKLADFNRKISQRIHDRQLPTTLNFSTYIILPHTDFNQTNIDFFKSIGVKATLLTDADSLIVKDEALLSGSSGSDSSPDKAG